MPRLSPADGRRTGGRRASDAPHGAAGRRLALSLVLSAGVLIAAAVSFPGLAPRDAVRALRPAAEALGLDQDWAMFAPEPRVVGLGVEAVVRWSDGETTVWRPVARDPVLGAYSDYRWRKWTEHLVQDGAGRRMWRPAAEHVALQLPPRRGAVPVELRLVRRVQPVAPLGDGRRPAALRTELFAARLRYTDGAAP